MPILWDVLDKESQSILKLFLPETWVVKRPGDGRGIHVELKIKPEDIKAVARTPTGPMR